MENTELQLQKKNCFMMQMLKYMWLYVQRSYQEVCCVFEYLGTSHKFNMCHTFWDGGPIVAQSIGAVRDACLHPTIGCRFSPGYSTSHLVPCECSWELWVTTQVLGFLLFRWESQKEIWLLASSCLSFSCYDHLESESDSGISVILLLCLLKKSLKNILKCWNVIPS